MKVLTYIIFVFFLFILSFIAFFESPSGKKLAFRYLTDSIKKSGIHVEAKKMGGILPQKIDLTDFQIRGDGWEIKAKTLHIELSIWRLFKKELFVKELLADQIQYQEKGKSIPFENSQKIKFPTRLFVQHFHLTQVQIPEMDAIGEIEGSGRIGRNGKMRWNLYTEIPEQRLKFSLLVLGPLKGPYHGDIQGQFHDLPLSGAFTLSEKGDLRFDGHLQIQHAAPLALRMDLISQQIGKKIHLKYRTTHWAFGFFPIENVSGEIEGLWSEKNLQGDATFRGDFYKQPWAGKTNFLWSPKTPLRLNQWNVQGPTFTANGYLTIHPNLLLEGSAELNLEKIQALHLPQLPLFGSFSAQIDAQIIGKGQAFHVESVAENLLYSSLSAEKIALSLDLRDPFTEPLGIGTFTLTEGRWKDLEISSLSLVTADAHIRPFTLSIDGKWKTPFDLTLEGYWNFEKQSWDLNLQKLEGSFYDHPLSLNNPVLIEKSATYFQMTPLDLQLGGGTLNASFSHKKDQTDGDILVRQLPLDLLSVNPLDLAIGGFFNLEAAIHQKGDALSGKLQASIDQLEVWGDEKKEPIRATGNLFAEYENDLLQAKGALNSNEAPITQFSIQLPLHFTLWPLHTQLLYERPLDADVLFQGNVEEIFDFFDLGTHRIEGKADCHLNFSQTLNEPRVKGFCKWRDGLYQNYYTGTQLENIQAEWVGDGNLLKLDYLQAEDYQKKGILSATGEIHLLFQDHFPFHFHLDFKNLNCVEIDLVTTEANGQIEIEGDFQGATAKGDVTILQSQLTIPDHVPRTLPKLPVIYRNPIHPLEPVRPIFSEPYPLHLDLQVSAPEGIFIQGRGLNSEWKGDFALSGTIDSPAAKGKLELIRGDFEFASRRFKLSEGSLTLSGKEHEMPHLNIAATVEQNDVIITARIKGALNKPQLTFQSSPPLPMSSILAYLLFGEDLSEINGFQALQLANSIATLAGEGPDILENTRRTLGVDRLRIVTVPTGAEEGEDAIALQVGKYVAQGVIISVSQGAEDNSTNISIEVELKYGISFLAETQQQQEQGKFTIKWNLNY